MNGGNLAGSGVDEIDVVAAPGTATLDIAGGSTTVNPGGVRELHVSQPGTIVHVQCGQRMCMGSTRREEAITPSV
jgi:hypothetical protein